jgi:hypothetical protein
MGKESEILKKFSFQDANLKENTGKRKLKH